MRATLLLLALDLAVRNDSPPHVCRAAHDELLRELRRNGPAPEWVDYPAGRDYFLQRHP